MYKLYNLIGKVRVGQTLEFFESIGLHHPLEGVINPKYKLLRFIQLINFFAKR